MSWAVTTTAGNGHVFHTVSPGEFAYDVENYAVSTCDACRALVLDSDAAQHAAWHEAADQRITEVAERLQSTLEVNELWDGS